MANKSAGVAFLTMLLLSAANAGAFNTIPTAPPLNNVEEVPAIVAPVPEAPPTENPQDTTPVILTPAPDKAQYQGKYKSLREAAESGDAEKIRALIDDGVMPEPSPPNREEPTPLMLAVASGNADAVRSLINAGANLNAGMIQRENGMAIEGVSPLYMAIQNRDAATVKLLLESGATANTSITRSNARTSTREALLFTTSDPAMIAALLDGGASPDTTDANGETLYTRMLRKNDTAGLSMLKERGITQQTMSASGNTPTAGRNIRSSHHRSGVAGEGRRSSTQLRQP